MEKQRPKEAGAQAQDAPDPAPERDPKKAVALFSKMLAMGGARVVGGQ